MAPLFFEVQMNVLRVMQGRWEDREEATKRFIENYPKIPSQRAPLANLYCRLGRFEEARAELDQMAADDFSHLPRDGSWIVTLGSLAKVCSYLGDSRRAAKLYEMLLPYAGRQLVTGSAAVACGSVSRFLGVLAATTSRWDEAVAHFEDALQMDGRIGARPFVANTQQEYAAMLLSRGNAGDRERANQILDQAIATAEELGMQGVIKEAQALRAQS
jgi:tetratricopeptide (TPR) repeat protein